ncbi:hypothetical protein IMX26_16845 [Clostridium sp. 'deep sea']|uniref:PEP-utilizing enzyme n=1 Tax=Clostridium sp. 'deep sea' TaxID=2779445 RepID=UPI001896739E|nr:PEP-utilizing enzyme [Clostridium sp. 'deep sea']QOR35103.1 hypothetical protein IMX26_16845 [Clostridium sp. 'deep sea']
MSKRYDAMIAVGNKQYEELFQESLQLKSVQEKIEFCEHAMIKAFILSQTQALYCTEMTYASKIAKKLKKMYGDKYNAETLVQSLPRCVSQQLTINLNELAKFFSENMLEPNVEHAEFKRLLAKFGHRSSYELDFGAKRWAEDPAYLLNQVKSFMHNKMYERNLADIQHKRDKAEKLITDVYCEMKRDYGEKRAQKFKETMLAYRTAAGMREYPKFDIVRFISLGRKVALSVGEEYVKQGLINNKYDLFFLRKVEILTKQNLKEKVKNNKEEYSREMKRSSVPRIVLNTGETIYSVSKIDPNSKNLQGSALSPGVYEGVIKIVFDPHKALLKEGEIMVTESTNPAWTPLFATAGALIMEYGGPMSHGGIVAREYGIPAVVGISALKSRLKDGDRVRVDGSTGVVTILE